MGLIARAAEHAEKPLVRLRGGRNKKPKALIKAGRAGRKEGESAVKCRKGTLFVFAAQGLPAEELLEDHIKFRGMVISSWEGQEHGLLL